MLANHHKGYILVSVLFFLELFSLISIYQLKRISSSLKITQYQLASQKNNFEAAHLLFLKREAYLNHSETCLKPTESQSGLVYKPLSWWQRHGCGDRKENLSYWYLLERLDHSSKFFRLNVFVYGSNLLKNTIISITFSANSEE